MHSKLTQDRLKEFLSYDPETGSFVWIAKKATNTTIGAIAGFEKFNPTSKKSYWMIKIDGYKHPAHRLAWLYMNGAYPQLEIDHINGDSLDNRIKNLREVSRRENSKNLKLSIANKSGVPGVYLIEERCVWRVRVYLEGGTRMQRTFKDFFEACCFRKSFDRKNGFHINHGSPRLAA